MTAAGAARSARALSAPPDRRYARACGGRRDSPENKAELDARFTELYRAHLRDVYSYSYYRVGNHHDAEDLTEQTFLQAYRHFERALRESNGRPLRPWLIRIAHNLAANFYRDRSRKPESAIEDAGHHLRAAHDRVAGRGARGAQGDPRRRRSSCPTTGGRR